MLKINELGMGLHVGDSRRCVCPFCHGGSSHEKSFKITREPFGFLYICHRASCGKSGIRAGEFAGERKRKAFTPRSFRGSVTDIPSDIFETTLGKFELSVTQVVEQGIRYIPSMRRLFMPLYDYRGFTIAENLKAVDRDVKPKSLLNQLVDVPKLFFPLGYNKECKEVILVEDWISALCVHYKTQLAVACIFGTYLPPEALAQCKLLFLRLNLALDGDSAGMSAAAETQLHLIGQVDSKITLLPLGKDPKDLPKEELCQLLQSS